jgi:NitT/TauT family transport system substrate-binding protein
MTGASGAVAAERVVFGTPTPIDTAYAHVLYGIQLGFFEDEGIDLELVAVGGSGTLLPQVAAQQITFGQPNPDLPIVAVDKGEPFPLKFFFNIWRTQLFEFVVKADSPIESIADLEGKNIGVGGLSWGNIPMTRAMLAAEGLDPETDVTLLPVGQGPAAWTRFESGEIDALNLYAQQHEMMRLTGVDIRRLPLREEFRIIPSNGLVAHNETIEEQPNLVAGFGRAYAKSLVACWANAEACAKSVWVYDPAQRPPREQEAKWVSDQAQILLAVKPLMTTFEANEPEKLGYYSEASWKALMNAMKTGGQIERTDYDVSQFFTNRFIDEINDFDSAAVESLSERQQ